MCEITKRNFKEKLPNIRESLQNAKFIAIDLEFSALQPVQTPRLFDSNKERYTKLRLNLLQVIPLQIGITAFHFDPDSDDYFGDVFTFYVAPPVFGVIDKSYETLLHKINTECDKNVSFVDLSKLIIVGKFAFLGIPYINKDEEKLLRLKLESGDFFGEVCQMNVEFDNIIKTYNPIVAKWYKTSQIGDFLEIPDFQRYQHYPEIVYCLHKHLRHHYELWTYMQNGSFFVKKVSNEEFQKLKASCKLDENLIDNLIGFTHVFNILKAIKKPIIGHNILQDLMIMINNFDSQLPKSYNEFKSLTNTLFPIIFDTKTIFYQLRSTIPKEKLPEDTSLKALYLYFKDGLGRHLVVNTTAIENNLKRENLDNYHNAGWDSYCTGYIFFRLAFYYLGGIYPKNKKFVSKELVGGLSLFHNRVNVIRGATTHIRLDGEDPTSNRPPWLIVQSLKNEPVDLNDLMATLSSFGFVDIKKLSPKGNRVLVAVDNYRTAREIFNAFKTHQKLRIHQYHFLKHSPVAKAFLLSAVTISGTILLWLTHTMVKR